VEWYSQRKSEVFGAKSVHGQSSSVERWVKGRRLSDLMTSKKIRKSFMSSYPISKNSFSLSIADQYSIKTMSVDHL
jgi:hypothetical protein